MVYSLTYQRPAFVLNRGPTSSSDTSTVGFDKSNRSSIRSGKSRASRGIPDGLAFDKIIHGGTCPPCTVRDFMNYLYYVEHSAENLQFFLWYRDYVKRFKEANTSDISLAPEWTRAQQDNALQAAQAQATAQETRALSKNDIFTGSDFDSALKGGTNDSKDPFISPPYTPGDIPSNRKGSQPWDLPSSVSGYESSYSTSFMGSSYKQTAGEAFQSAGLKQPFSIQPFREEINRIIETYVASEAPRELNISDRERYALLRALEHTTHPSALHYIHHSVESSLRCQSHPNFVRWTICNGNRPRVIFARSVGVGLVLLGFLIAILLTLSKSGRGWRALAGIPWVVGLSTLVAAWKGMCVVLHGMHRRHLRPWELFDDAISGVELNTSFDSLGSKNSYEDEPWVIKYENRNIVRKIFDREVWIQEPALRQIQDTIFLQSILFGVLFAAIFCVIFVVLPKGNLF